MTLVPEATGASAEQSRPAGGFSRVTLVGRTNRADLVLPSDEPLGTLLGEAIAVLQESTAGEPRRRVFATAVGDVLPMEESLGSLQIADGTVLRLVTEDEVPPPPVVTDVTEETATDLEARTGRWGDAARTATLTSAAGLAGGVLALDTIGRVGAHDALVQLLVAAGAVAVVALLAAVARVTRPAVGLAVLAAAGAAVAGVVAGPARGWTVADRLGVALGAGGVALVVAAAARRSRGAAVGGLAAVLLPAAWLALRHGPLQPEEADAIVIVAGAAVLGLLPHWAVTTSGLTRLDDRRLAGGTVTRRRLDAALLAAHASLIWTTVAVAAVMSVAGALLAVQAHQWPCWLAATAGVVAVLRSRAFPLVAEVVALVVAAAVVAVALLLVWIGRAGGSAWPTVATAAVALVAVVATVADPPAHVRARVRGIADRVESLAVVALLPLLLGVFGVFGRLLHTF
ncbi:EsaB/YukD family protein [Jatrophihabitans fulvus]